MYFHQLFWPFNHNNWSLMVFWYTCLTLMQPAWVQFSLSDDEDVSVVVCHDMYAVWLTARQLRCRGCVISIWEVSLFRCGRANQSQKPITCWISKLAKCVGIPPPPKKNTVSYSFHDRKHSYLKSSFPNEMNEHLHLFRPTDPKKWLVNHNESYIS